MPHIESLCNAERTAVGRESHLVPHWPWCVPVVYRNTGREYDTLSYLMRVPYRVFARNLGKMSAQHLSVNAIASCVVKRRLSWVFLPFERRGCETAVLELEPSRHRARARTNSYWRGSAAARLVPRSAGLRIKGLGMIELVCYSLGHVYPFRDFT